MELTQEVLLELFRYDRESGKIFWLPRDVKYFKVGRDSYTPERSQKTWNTKNAGNEAFTRANLENYLVGSLFGKFVQSHRVIWCMEYGYWPNKIDHIDGNRQNNRLENLREVTDLENAKNRKLPSNNTSGHQGVFWHKKTQKWLARISCNKCIYNLGSFESYEDAVNIRKSYEVAFGFHPNHGRLGEA
jgi:hypothetical protein